MYKKRSTAAAPTRKRSVATSTNNLRGCGSLAILLLLSLVVATNANATATATTTTLKVGLTSAPATAITTAAYGTSVTLTANVSPVAAGTVTFYNNSVALAAAVTVSAGSATLASTTLPAGTESLTATFNPTTPASFATSTSAALTSFSVTQVTPTITLKAGLTSAPTVAITTASFGASVTLTATAAPAATTGTVNFMDGGPSGTQVGTCTLSAGTCASAVTTLPLGSNSLTAVYVASTNYAAATSTPAASVTVTQTTTTTALAVGLTSAPATAITAATYGASVTLTATVTPTTAVGTVTFSDGSTTLGSSALSSGTATLATTALTLGSNSLTATFTPTVSADFTTTTSTAKVVTVTQATTTTALAVGLTSAPATPITTAAYGASVTLTATVTPASAAGTVTFTDGVTTLGSSAVSSGTATLATTALTLGSNSLTATFTPTVSADFTTTTSTAKVVTVTQATTSTVLSAALTSAPSVPITTAASGANVTLTAIVSPAEAGTVTFKNNGVAMGSAVNVVSGAATMATTALTTTGANPLTAVFTPTTPADDLASTSNTLTFTVTAPTTSTALVVSSATAVYGQSVTLTANVTPSLASGGTVTFSNGSHCTLASGTCSASTTTLPLGLTSLTATYGGDSTYAASSASPSQGVTVSVNPTTVAATAYNLGTTTPIPNAAITFGTAFTLSATVTASGSVTPSAGHVSFYDSSTLLGSVAVSGGVATFNTSTTLAAGRHYFIASYGGTYSSSGAVQLSTSLSPAAQVTISNATPLTITASSPTVTLGAAVPAIIPSFASGSFVNPDTTTSLATATRQPICTTTYTPSSPVGSYPTSCSSAIDTNYTISYVAGLVTVNAATPTLTITAPSPASVTFGSTVTISASNAAYSGFVGGDTKTSQSFTSTLSGTLTCSSDYTTISPPDTYLTHCSGLTSSKYTIAYADGSFTVTPVTPTITWPTTAGAITYGNAQSSSVLGSCSATFNGFPVPGSCAWTNSATIPHVNATQSVTWTPSGEYAADYATTVSAVSLNNVTAATLTLPGVTAPTASSIPVLSALSASKLSSGSVRFTLPATSAIVTVPGTFTWASTSVAPSVPGTSSIQVTFTPTGPNAADYNVLTNAGTASLTVTKATPTITAPTNCNSTNYAYNYGQALSTCTLSTGSAAVGSTSVAGTFAWANGATVPAKGTDYVSVIFTPAAATPQLYNSVTFTIPVLVNGVALTVNWPTASNITYGQFLSSSTLSGGYACPTTCNASNHVSGSFGWTPSDNASSTVPHVGVAPQSVTFTPTSTNYSAPTHTVAVTVLPLAPTVTVWPTISPIYTPAALSTDTAFVGGSATGLGNVAVAGTFAWTDGTITPAAGTAQYGVTFTPTVGGNGSLSGNSDYSSVNGSVSITVNPCGLQDNINNSFSTAQNDYLSTQTISALTFDLEGSINESVVCAVNTGSPFTVNFTDPALTSGSSSSYTSDSVTNGTNAAVLAYGPAATAAAGVTIAITNDGSNPTSISTTGDYGNGIFASMGGTVSIDNGSGASTTTITTSGNYSNALAATYAGTLTVANVQATTSGNYSAVIMTGGTSGGGSPIGAGYGTVTLNGGSYSSSGTHSPGILAAGISPTFSSVTVNEGASGAAISASNDAAVVVEGGNTVTINSPTNLTTISGAGGDYHGIFLYLGGTGDASAGPGTFAMTGGTIVYTCDATPTSANPCDGSGSASLAADQNYPATVFAATNTTSTAPTNISLTDVTVINTTPSDIDLNNTNGTLLTAAALSLGNPAYVNFTAKGEQLIGDIIVDTNSIVNLTLEADANSIGSSLTGNIGGPTTYYLNQTVGTVNLTIDANSTWVVSGNSYVTTLHNSGSGNISCQNFGQCAVYVGGSTTPLAGVN